MGYYIFVSIPLLLGFLNDLEAFLEAQNLEMEARSRLSNSFSSDLHPIIDDYVLPVELEGFPKRSGIQNLSRIGWDEQSTIYTIIHVSLETNYI